MSAVKDDLPRLKQQIDDLLNEQRRDPQQQPDAVAYREPIAGYDQEQTEPPRQTDPERERDDEHEPA